MLFFIISNNNIFLFGSKSDKEIESIMRDSVSQYGNDISNIWNITISTKNFPEYDDIGIYIAIGEFSLVYECFDVEEILKLFSKDEIIRKVLEKINLIDFEYKGEDSATNTRRGEKTS